MPLIRPLTRLRAARSPLVLVVSLLTLLLVAGCHGGSHAGAPSRSAAVAKPGVPGGATSVTGGMSTGANLSASDLNPAMSDAQKQAILRRKKNE